MNTVSTYIYGGLGNNLFQISTGYSVSLDENANFIVDVSELINPHKPLTNYENNIFRKIKFSNTKLDIEVFSVGSLHYSPIPEFKKKIKLNGFFQSEKYFKKHKKELISLYEPTDEINNILKKKYGNYLKEKTCSIHVRRGDYLHLENYHPTLPMEYYKKSYEIIGDDSLYFIFSDDINFCRDQFGFIKNKIFIDDLEDYEELYLMSFCDNNIIANSSFSWWGAWLNRKKNTVISPRKWFGSAYSSYITDDLYSENWIII